MSIETKVLYVQLVRHMTTSAVGVFLTKQHIILIYVQHV